METFIVLLKLEMIGVFTEFINQINTFNGEDEPSISYDGEKFIFKAGSPDGKEQVALITRQQLKTEY